MNNTKLTTAEFISRASLIHDCIYNYNKVHYVNTSTNVIITCNAHGDFNQTPGHHINRKQGCPKCGITKSAKAKQSNLDEFILKAKKIHNDKYTYSNAIYTAAKNKITITCPIHGDFTQLVSGHLSGYGCKLCMSNGKGRVPMEASCNLYYLHILGTTLYKVGITSRPLTERYRTSFDRDQFEVINIINYDTGREAYEAEQAIHKKYSKFKYIGAKVLKTGNTEIYTKDILELDDGN